MAVGSLTDTPADLCCVISCTARAHAPGHKLEPAALVCTGLPVTNSPANLEYVLQCEDGTSRTLVITFCGNPSSSFYAIHRKRTSCADDVPVQERPAKGFGLLL